jgi:transposase IS66 family protein
MREFTGIIVSDRYQNYFHPGWEHIAGNQACCAHLLRDLQDAAETYPGTIWPVQAQRALRGLIHGWHAALEEGLARIPATVADPLIREFRHAVLAGLASIPRIPGPRHSTAQRPAATCSNSAVTGKLTYCGSPQTRRSGRRTTSASAASARTRPSRRSPAA